MTPWIHVAPVRIHNSTYGYFQVDAYPLISYSDQHLHVIDMNGFML